MSIRARFEKTVKSLRGQFSKRLRMDSAFSIRVRSMFNIGEFVLSNPRDLLSNSIRARRTPGFTGLHIFFRHMHTRHNTRSRDPDKIRPRWFSHEHCFENLISTIEKSPWADKVAVTVVYDGSEADLGSDFIASYRSRQMKFRFSIKRVEAGSNIGSWLELLALVKSEAVPEDEVIFVMENDYLHVDGWLDNLVDLYRSDHQFDYVSLYDHTDFYDLAGKRTFPAYRGIRAELFVTKSHHWRDAPSTCGTFLVQKRVFLEDFAVWTSRLSDFYAFTYLRLLKRRVLLTPVPGLSTHCMEGFLSPTVNWASQ